MSDVSEGQVDREGMPRWRVIMRVVVGLVVALALFFLPAGTIDWIEAWLLLAFFLGFTLTLYAWLRHHDPALLAERQQSGPNVERWDRVIMGVYSVVLLGLPIVAGLDRRFGWSGVALPVQLAGWVGLAAASAIIAWSMASNPYLSGRVRIQEERRHQVVGDGPYRFVRHPMYVGVLLFFLALPPVLGSFWALVPGGVCTALFVVRTALEDRTLCQKLPGYRDYAQRVRYRLIPRVW